MYTLRVRSEDKRCVCVCVCVCGPIISISLFNAENKFISIIKISKILDIFVKGNISAKHFPK